MWIEIGPWMIIRKDNFPMFLKVHKLARMLTENDMDDILNGKKHLHSNPKRRKPEKEATNESS